ncbi:hypothetical protein AAC387_Pa03g3610 [Persea americana]
MSKLLEAAIDAEDCRKELDQKNKSQRIQASAPSASKGKKKEEVFNIEASKAPRKAQDPEDEAARKEEYEMRKNAKYFFDDIFKTLLEHGKLELPFSKRPNQEGRIDDPNYGPYHRMISHHLKECFILNERIQDMLAKGVIQLDQKCDIASVKMVAFGSFEPTNIGSIISKTVEFRPINKVENSDELVSITTSFGKVIRVHLDLISDDSWEPVKSRSTSKKGKKMKRLLRNSRQTVKAQPIKETKEETEPAPRKKGPAESSKTMRKLITLADFLLPLTEEEDELQISNCNRISK